MIPECTFCVIPIHLCNFLSILNLLADSNGHLPNKLKLAAFFEAGTRFFDCMILLCQNIYLCKF